MNRVVCLLFVFFKLCVKLNEPVQMAFSSSLRTPRPVAFSNISLYLIICRPLWLYRVGWGRVYHDRFLYRSVMQTVMDQDMLSLQDFMYSYENTVLLTADFTVAVWFSPYKGFVTDVQPYFTCSR